MENTWFLAAVWVGLALVATLLAIWFRISTALSEIVVGTVAQLVIGAFVGRGALGASSAWITFPAGAELDPVIFRTKWKEAVVVGLAGFSAPFLGATAVARYVLGWSSSSSWLAGIALSTTSVAVVYAVMLELLELFRERGLAGSTVLRGIAGFGASSVIHTTRTVTFSEDLPVVIEVVDDEARITGVQVLRPLPVAVPAAGAGAGAKTR